MKDNRDTLLLHSACSHYASTMIEWLIIMKYATVKSGLFPVLWRTWEGMGIQWKLNKQFCYFQEKIHVIFCSFTRKYNNIKLIATKNLANFQHLHINFCKLSMFAVKFNQLASCWSSSNFPLQLISNEAKFANKFYEWIINICTEIQLTGIILAILAYIEVQPVILAIILFWVICR